MTVAQNIKCPSCGQVFHLKFQIDDSINWSKWPIVVDCPECYDRIEMTFDKNGLMPKQKQANDGSKGILICYCGGLPTPAELYYQEIPVSTGFHSVFLVLRMIYGEEAVGRYNFYRQRLQNGIIQWGRVMEEAYRMICGSKIKPQAYYNKLKSIFIDSVPKEAFQTPEDCVRHYEEMIKTVYRGLDFGRFKDGPLKSLFDSLDDGFLNDKGPEKILEVGLKTNYNSGLLKDVRRRINLCVKDLAKILPACFLDFNGGQGADLLLLTGSIDHINDMYAQNFEVICKCLPLIMGLYNSVYNEDPDCFKLSDGTQVDKKMKDFMQLDNGTKLRQMMGLPAIKAAFEDILDAQIRNGINHENKDFDIDTQTCKYLYDNTRPENFVECRLIDLAYRVLYQLRCLLLIHRYLLMIDNGLKVH